jgi:O-antigen/teichoic acid export membrane protein
MVLDLIKSIFNYYKSSRIVKNSFYNIVGQGGQALVLFISTPLLIKGMGGEEFGLWMIFNSLFSFMGFFEMGLGACTIKYIAEYSCNGNEAGVSSVVMGSIGFFFILSMILTIPLYFLAPYIIHFLKISDKLSLVGVKTARIAILGLLPVLLGTVSTAVPLGLQRFEIANLINWARLSVIQVAAICVVFWGGHIFDVIVAKVLILWAFAIISLIIAIYMLLPYGLKFYFSWDYARKIWSFSSLVTLQNLGSQIFNSVDRLVVGRVLGLEAVTYYSIGTLIATKILQVVGGISQSLLPAASEAHGGRDYRRLLNLLKRGTYLAALVSGILGGGLIIISEPFLKFWLGAEVMVPSLSCFKILILAYTIISVSAPAYYIANGMGSPGICSLGTISGGLLTILLIYILGNLWQLNGAALANFGYVLNFLILKYIYTRIRHGLERPIS